MEGGRKRQQSKCPLVSNDGVLHIQWKTSPLCASMESNLQSTIYHMKLLLYKISILMHGSCLEKYIYHTVNRTGVGI